jgi:dienelactone hydrolase
LARKRGIVVYVALSADGFNQSAQHAFNNDANAARYDKAAAELAWGRTLDFLRRQLGAAPGAPKEAR